MVRKQPQAAQLIGLAQGIARGSTDFQGPCVVLLRQLQVAAGEVHVPQVAELVGLTEGVIDATEYLQGLLEVLFGPLKIAAVAADVAQAPS